MKICGSIVCFHFSTTLYKPTIYVASVNVECEEEYEYKWWIGEDTEGRGGGVEELGFIAVSFSSLNTE